MMPKLAKAVVSHEIESKELAGVLSAWRHQRLERLARTQVVLEDLALNNAAQIASLEEATLDEVLKIMEG